MLTVTPYGGTLAPPTSPTGRAASADRCAPAARPVGHPSTLPPLHLLQGGP